MLEGATTSVPPNGCKNKCRCGGFCRTTVRFFFSCKATTAVFHLSIPQASKNNNQGRTGRTDHGQRDVWGVAYSPGRLILVPDLFNHHVCLCRQHPRRYRRLYSRLSMGVWVAFAWLGALRVLSGVLIIGVVRHNKNQKKKKCCDHAYVGEKLDH